MNKCSICSTSIILNPTNNERNVGSEKDGEYYCIPCHEAVLFMSDTLGEKKKIYKEPIVKNISNIGKSVCCCYKCGKPYENNKCNDCNILDPLNTPRPTKKKRKRK